MFDRNNSMPTPQLKQQVKSIEQGVGDTVKRVKYIGRNLDERIDGSEN